MKSTEYGERPLKLVLKVAGNEVTTGSSSREHIYDEKPDYDKHKDKKKKKKKREDKDRSGPVSPVDEKKKKKVRVTVNKPYLQPLPTVHAFL